MGSGRYGRDGPARERLLAILSAAAEAAKPCPSNGELRRGAGVVRESRVTKLLGVLRRHGRIEVARRGGARRIAVLDPVSGAARWTDWSRPMAGLAVDARGDVGGDVGGDAMGEALGGRRFADATPDERRRWARGTPRSAPATRPPPDVSPTGCALADLRGNPELAPEAAP